MELTTQVADAKRQAWGEMGVQVTQVEMQLQAQSQAAIMSLVKPLNIDQVPNAEMQLKTAKATKKAIEELRKKYTSKLDEVASRLMQPEKDADAAIKENEKAIIAIKTAWEAEQRRVLEIQQEVARIKQYVADSIVNHDTKCKQEINEKVAKAYEYALNKSITVEGLEVYLNTVRTRINETNGFTPTFSAPRLVNITADEYKEIAEEFNVTPAADYLADFYIQLEERFKDYALAVQNKERALQIANEEAAKEAAKIAEEKKQAETMNALQANAEVFNAEPTSDIKQLKKSYEIDMPETVDSVLLIMAAFAANKSKCLEKLRITKWFTFSAVQAGNALAKLKSEDNNFTATGINFKEVSKL